MSRITIYSKAGVPKYEASGLELHDTWMGESYVSFDINSPTPIDIQIGDYLIYRGEVFSAYNIPSVLKQARRMSYGNAFEYKGVKFSSAGMELTDIRFFDVVLNDNEVHYTTLPTFSFYCESVDDLLDRFQANTNRENVSQWYFISPSYDRTIQRYDEGSAEQQEAIRLWEESYGPDHTSPQCDVSKEKRGTSISVDKKSVWDSLSFILNDFGLHFICKGHAIIVGFSGVAADHIFRYGKGNGLASIERVADTNQQVVTKLYAYGSDKNLPSHYYAELNIRAYGYLAAYDQEKQYYLTNQSYVEAYFTTKNDNDKYIGSIEYGEVIYDVVFDQDTFGNLIIYGVPYTEYLIDAGKFYFVTGVKKSRLPDKEVIPGAIPNNMAVNMLMLPGFPTYSLSQLCRCEYVNGETIFYYKKTPTSQESEFLRVEGNHVFQFSEDKYRPFIVSNNAEQLGIKEGDIHFIEENDDNGLKAIYPSIEEMTVGDVFGNDSTERLDEIYACDVITDSGYFADGEEIPTFKITLKNLGFDLRQAFAAGGSDMTLSMKDGSCGGRDFKVTAVKQVQNGRWELTCERCYDNALELYFPYSYNAATGGEPSANEPYQIMAGDHFVLTEIEIEDTTYIQAASVKALRKAILWLVANDYTRFTYLPKVDEIYMARQDEQAQQTGSVSYHDTLRAGLLMLFEDSDLDVDGSVYIDSLTIKEDGNNGIPTYDITLREEKQVGTMQRIQNQINSLSSTVNGSSGGSSVPQIKQLIKTYGADLFLSKTNEDTAQGLIGFVKGLWVKTKGLFGFSEQGDVTARSLKATGSSGETTPDTDNVTQKNLGLEVSESGVIGGILRVAQSLLTKTIQSLNFSGSDSLTGTGWQLTDDYGTGRSRLIVDDAVFRGKVTMNQLEVRKLIAMGGNYVFPPAASIIEQVDYYDGDGRLLGYTRIKVPWVLRLIPLSLFGRYLSRYKWVRSTITAEDLAQVKFYRCWLKADDGSTQTINTWRAGMLARCQTFDTSQIENGTHDGTYSDSDVSWGKNVTNKLYWRAVVAVADGVDKEHYEGQTIALEDGRKHNYIDIANYTDDDNVQLYLTGSDHVSAGDHIVCFGDWKERQLANFVTIETIGSDAPAVKEFVGVGYTDGTSIDWNFDGKMRTRVSPTAGNRFIAPEFIIETDGEFVKYDECVGFDTPSNPKDGDVMLLSYDDISNDYQVEVWDAATSTWNDEHDEVGQRYYCTTNGHVYEATATGWKDLGIQLGQSVSSLKVGMDGIVTQVSNLNGSLSTLSQTVGGIETRVQNAEGNIATLNQTATGLTAEVTSIKQGKNLLSGVLTAQGWKDDTNADAACDAVNVSIKTAGDGATALITPQVTLQKGSKYTLSFDVAGGDAAVQWSDGTAIGTATGTGRKTLVIDLTQAAADVTGKIKIFVTELSYPMLEIGEVATEFVADSEETSAFANLTSGRILLAVQNALGLTGIDITNGTIELRGNKVVFTNSAGTITGKISIDPDTGTLVAEEVKVSGQITATSGSFTGDIAGNGLVLKDGNDNIRVTIKPDALANMTVLQNILQTFLGYDGLMINNGSGKLVKFTDAGFELLFPAKTFGNLFRENFVRGLKFSQDGLQVPYQVADNVVSSYVNYNGFQGGIKLLREEDFVLNDSFYYEEGKSPLSGVYVYTVQAEDTFLIFSLSAFSRNYYVCLGDGAGVSTAVNGNDKYPEIGRKITVVNSSTRGTVLNTIKFTGGYGIKINNGGSGSEGIREVSQGEIYDFLYLDKYTPGNSDGNAYPMWLAEHKRS